MTLQPTRSCWLQCAFFKCSVLQTTGADALEYGNMNANATTSDGFWQSVLFQGRRLQLICHTHKGWSTYTATPCVLAGEF